MESPFEAFLFKENRQKEDPTGFSNLCLIKKVNESVGNLAEAIKIQTNTMKGLIQKIVGAERDVKVLKDENRGLKKKIRDLEQKYVLIMEQLQK